MIFEVPVWFSNGLAILAMSGLALAVALLVMFCILITLQAWDQYLAYGWVWREAVIIARQKRKVERAYQDRRWLAAFSFVMLSVAFGFIWLAWKLAA